MFSKGELVQWIKEDGAVIQELMIQGRRDAPEGPWWILILPSKTYCKAVIHESRLQKV